MSESKRPSITVYTDGFSLGAGGHAAGDTLVAIERVIGSNFADTIYGTAAAERFEGGLGVGEKLVAGRARCAG